MAVLACSGVASWKTKDTGMLIFRIGKSVHVAIGLPIWFSREEGGEVALIALKRSYFPHMRVDCTIKAWAFSGLFMCKDECKPLYYSCISSVDNVFLVFY